MIKLPTAKEYILGLQHVLAMFGSTVLVPFLTGLDTSIALLCAGLGTLIFHILTKGIVPVFLGSSFAFISAIILVLKQYGIPELKGGIIVAGLIYILLAGFIKIYGSAKIKKLFPPIVLGPIIIAIGLKLSPVALAMSGYKADGSINYTSILIASITLIVMLGVSFLQRSFFRLMPIIMAMLVGYIFTIILGLVDFTPIINAPWFGYSQHSLDAIFTLPKFNLTAILVIAPIALVTFIEHMGDIQTNGAVVGKDFVKNPGLHRTVIGDGLATLLAGFLGGPANTTYGENTGVLAVTRIYDPRLLRIAAIMSILLSMLGKVSAIIQNLPQAIMGGISLVLFGLISSMGIKVIVQNHVDFNNYKNLVIPAIIIITGVFIDTITITPTVQLSGLFIATILGITLNKILPDKL
ncbi:Uracil permease [Candidatus Hepatincola sp. Pdp]